MSNYTAIIHCEKCGKVLAEINAYHEPKADWFVPQDIISRDYKINSIYCQDCLNESGDINDNSKRT